mmetsp:Transcript_23834/g.46977  ORF Transcript_23834/g.46977 Transcript_23834/m.46977 type:complete len:102 (-) Transcript_23834:1117-1422(-)
MDVVVVLVVVLVMMVLVLVLVEKEEEGKEEKKGSPDGSGAQGRLAAGAQKSIPSSNLVNIPYTCHRAERRWSPGTIYSCHLSPSVLLFCCAFALFLPFSSL